MKPLTDQQLDEFLTEVRRPDAADLGAAERFLNRQALASAAVPLAALPASPARRRSAWPAWLAAAALIGGVVWLRPGAPAAPLPSSAAYAAYTSALGSEW